MWKRFLVCVAVVCVVVVLGLAATVVWAALIESSVSVNWDDPGFSEGYIVLEWEAYNPSLFMDAEARRAVDGSVVGSVSLASDCVPGTQDSGAGAGQCGSLATWAWEADDYLTGEQVEEWVRVRWSQDGFPDIYGVYVPGDCELPAGYCSGRFDEATSRVDIGAMCVALLESCGTRQDERGFWYRQVFEGTGAPPPPDMRYLPIILKAFEAFETPERP